MSRVSISHSNMDKTNLTSLTFRLHSGAVWAMLFTAAHPQKPQQFSAFRGGQAPASKLPPRAGPAARSPHYRNRLAGYESEQLPEGIALSYPFALTLSNSPTTSESRDSPSWLMGRCCLCPCLHQDAIICATCRSQLFYRQLSHGN